MRACLGLIFVLVLAVSGEENDATTPAQSTADLRTRLYNHLTQNYQKNINPDKPELRFGVSLIDVDIDENKNTLESNVWLRYQWNDGRLVWDAKEWGTQALRVGSGVFWKPDISLFNGADLSRWDSACWDSNVVVYNTGKVIWVPPCHLSSFCQSTLRQHPYQPVTCSLKFGSWTYDNEIMDIDFSNNTSTIDTGVFQDTSNWKIVGTSGVKNVKHYDCCTEPYADLTYNITLRRKPDSESLCTV